MRPGRSPAAGRCSAAAACGRAACADVGGGDDGDADRSTAPAASGRGQPVLRLRHRRPARRRARCASPLGLVGADGVTAAPTCPTELTVTVGADDGGEPVRPTDGRPPRRRASPALLPGARHAADRRRGPLVGADGHRRHRPRAPCAGRRTPRLVPGPGDHAAPLVTPPPPTPGASTPSARPSRCARSTTVASTQALAAGGPSPCSSPPRRSARRRLRPRARPAAWRRRPPPTGPVRARRDVHRPRRRRRPPPTSRPRWA